MLILDVNPLVYAFRPDLPDHERHRRMLLQIMAGPEAFIASFVLAYDADLVTSDAAMGRFPGVRIRDVAGD